MKTIIAVLILALAGCTGRKGLPVRYVVPDGYRGVLSVTFDASAGSPVVVTNGEYVITFPESGQLAVSSLDFLRGEHTIRAEWANGETLSIGSPMGDGAQEVAFRFVYYQRNAKTAVCVVGTEDEASAAFSMDPGTLRESE